MFSLRQLSSRPATDPLPGDRSIGRAAVRGAFIGYFAVVILVGSVLLVAGAGLGRALAVGAFVGIWGGPGWGGMVAAQVHADRLAEEERQAARAALGEHSDRLLRR
jgi:hypothetical protein